MPGAVGRLRPGAATLSQRTWQLFLPAEGGHHVPTGLCLQRELGRVRRFACFLHHHLFAFRLLPGALA